MYWGCEGCHWLGLLMLVAWWLCWWKVWGPWVWQGTLELMEDVEGLGVLLDGTFGCLPKALEL